jgi:DNA-binding SARP family transcriptional activator/TolB-like protein
MAETARVVPLVRAGEALHRATLLGGFRLTLAGGADATPRARKTRALLAFLLITRRSWTRERLAGLLWGDRADEQAKASLRQALYELRGLATGPAPLLVVRRDEVAVRAEACELDLDRLAAMARDGEIGPLATALDGAQLTLLADLDGAGPDFDEWLTAERFLCREKLVAAAVEAGEAALDAGGVAEVRRLADALERADPLNEPAARLGLRADRGAGDLSALHRRYGRFSQRLRADLDAEPAPETHALLQARPARGPRANEEVAPPSSPARRRHWPWFVAAVLVLVALAAALAWSRYTAPPPATLAVLPFEAAGAGRQNAYFGAGISEAVLDLLARDPELKVVGSNSARLFGAGDDPLRTARRLGLGYVLRGEARTAEGRLSVSARLVRARDGRTLWSDRYQRPAEDVFAVQSEIAAAVAQQLGARIAPRSNPHLTTRPEVYDRYLQARGLARERRTAQLTEAHRLLLEATRLDPDYAPAFAALSQVTMLLADHPTSYGDIPIPQAQAEARRYARRALELAPDLGEAYGAYGLISLGDAQSLPFYARAVALDPQRPEYHRWLAQSYSAVGREADALAEYQRSAALDPLLWISLDHLVGQLMIMGREPEAVAAVERFARISNDPHGVARVRGSLARQQGRLAEYLRLTESAVQQWPGERTLRTDLAKAWSLLGENERAARALTPRDTIGRLALTGDTEGLAREARRMGASFWDNEPGYWAFAEELVRGGHGALLLQLYDAEFDGVGDFYGRAPSKALPCGPALIAALNRAGRRDEVDALAQFLLQRLDADEKSGMEPSHAAYDRAAILALTGRPDQAVDQLTAAVRGDWVNMAWVPARLSERLPFQSLRGHPRLAGVQAELDARINRQRALLGLPPLKN